MKAILNYGPHDFRLEDIPIPKAGSVDIVVKTKACGICAGDIKTYQGAPYIWDITPPWVKTPVIPGHEFFGEIVEIGSKAQEKYGLKIGDYAIAEHIVPCGECIFCKRGHYNACNVHNVFGWQGGIDDGGFAEYIKYPEKSIVHKVPKNFTLESGVMIEPLACAIHAVQRAKIELEDRVVIAGMGSLGLCMLQVARLKNPELLIALDKEKSRLNLAKKTGADIVIDVERENAVDKVKELTNGYGCDVYIEATADPRGVTQGLEMIRRQGRFVEFSVFSKPTSADWSVIGDRKELTIYGAHLAPYTYPLAIRYIMEKKVKVDEIVTHKFPLGEFKKALDFAAQKREGAIKVALVP